MLCVVYWEYSVFMERMNAFGMFVDCRICEGVNVMGILLGGFKLQV